MLPPAVTHVPAPTVCWHATPGETARALLSAAPGAVARVHTFVIPPGMLGGLYAASFWETTGVLHRFVLPYVEPSLLAWDLKPLREALASLPFPETDGRVELGRNTGDVLAYFLPSVGEHESPRTAEARRQKSCDDWLRAACEGGAPLPRLVLPLPVDPQPVACLSRGGFHFLFRLDGGGTRTLAAVEKALDGKGAARLAANAPLCRDVLGEWREG